MFGSNKGERHTNFNRYYFAQKTKKGAIIDERFNHGDRLPITSQMCFQEILVILIIPLGTNRHLRQQTQDLGTKSNDH
jgi:hypothetical protein